jgi:hypothetical protein
MLEPQKLGEPLPHWVLMPLGLGIMIFALGLAMPWLYPQKSLWTEDDALKHAALASQAHAAHHAAAHAQTNKLPTSMEDAAKARWFREQYDQSAQRLRHVREGGTHYGQWLMVIGAVMIAIGITAVWMLRQE